MHFDKIFVTRHTTQHTAAHGISHDDRRCGPRTDYGSKHRKIVFRQSQDYRVSNFFDSDSPIIFVEFRKPSEPAKVSRRRSLDLLQDTLQCDELLDNVANLPQAVPLSLTGHDEHYTVRVAEGCRAHFCLI